MKRNLIERAKKNEKLREFLTTQQQSGYEIIRHPRFLNKPISCLAGKHQLEFKLIDGLLHYYCTKCGVAMIQGLHDKTWSKNDIHKIATLQKEQHKPKTNEQKLQESWEALQLLRKKFTDKQIQEMIENRRKGIKVR